MRPLELLFTPEAANRLSMLAHVDEDAANALTLATQSIASGLSPRRLAVMGIKWRSAEARLPGVRTFEVRGRYLIVPRDEATLTVLDIL